MSPWCRWYISAQLLKLGREVVQWLVYLAKVVREEEKVPEDRLK